MRGTRGVDDTIRKAATSDLVIWKIIYHFQQGFWFIFLSDFSKYFETFPL